jgi:hypothetical protein
LIGRCRAKPPPQNFPDERLPDRLILHAAGVLARSYNLILNIHDRAKHVRSAGKFTPLNAPTRKRPMPSFSAMPREIPSSWSWWN